MPRVKTQPTRIPTPDMAAACVELRVHELRQFWNLTYAEMSRRLYEIGADIPPLGLRRLERSERRVEAGELIALSLVLRTNPNYLLGLSHDGSPMGGE